MKICKNCSAEVEPGIYVDKEFCSRDCYHLYKRADSRGYLSNWMSIHQVKHTQFHEALREYVPNVAMTTLINVANNGVNLRGGYITGLPCDLAIGIACTVYDFDHDMQDFDYRLVFRPVEGFDHVADGNARANQLFSTVMAICGDSKRFLDDYTQMVSDARDRTYRKRPAEEYDDIVKAIDSRLNREFTDGGWRGDVWVPYGHKRSVVLMAKMLNPKSKYWMIGPIALMMSELFDVMGGYKVDPRFLLDEITPNDAFRLREVFLGYVPTYA